MRIRHSSHGFRGAVCFTRSPNFRGLFGGVALFYAMAMALLVSETRADNAPTTQRMPAFVPFLQSTDSDNQGWPTFYAALANGRVAITGNGITYQFEHPTRSSSKSAVASTAPFSITETFLSATNLRPFGLNRLSGNVSVFRGDNPSEWQRQVPAYSRVGLGEIAKGVRIELVAKAENFEKIYFVEPGSDPGLIVGTFIQPAKLEITADGELAVHTKSSKFALTRPFAYQETGTKRQEVAVSYRVLSAQSYGFVVGDYDKTKQLVIDPLLASTYVGGNDDEHYAFDDPGAHVYVGHKSIVRDNSGDVYIVAQTKSPNFPIPGTPYDSSFNDTNAVEKNDVVIFKMSSGLDQLLAATYLGGTADDYGASVTLDSSGAIIVTGFTKSSDFPTTVGTFDRTFSGSSDIFVSKLSADFSTLIASTLVGGSQDDRAYSIIAAPDNSLYVGGHTLSADFPTTSAWDNTYSGSAEGVVFKLSSNLSSLTNMTFLGDAGNDYVRQIVLNVSGRVVVLGFTDSNSFPAVVSGTYDTQKHPGVDADSFISIFTGDLVQLKSGTFIGGADNDYAQAFAVDQSGNILITGTTISTDFPTVAGAHKMTRTGTSYDVFVSRFNSSLTSLLNSTYFGGSQWERVYDIALDNQNTIYLAGDTTSADLVPTAFFDAYSRNLQGASDGFLARMDIQLANLYQDTYFGGTGNTDKILGLITNNAGDLLFYGLGTSTDIPITSNPYQGTSGGAQDLFVGAMTSNLYNDHPSHHLLVRDVSNNSSFNLVAGNSVNIKVSVLDALDNVLTAFNGDYDVIFSGSNPSHKLFTSTCKNKANVDKTFSSATTLTFSNGTASTTCSLYKAESGAIDVELTSSLHSYANPNYDLDFSVSPAAFAASGTYISVTPTPGSVVQSVNITVTAADMYGNAVGAATGANRQVDISVTGTNARSLTGGDQADGTYTVSYLPNTSGYDVISGTISAQGGGSPQAIGNDDEGTHDGIFHLTVYDLGLDHYEVRYEAIPNSGIYSSTLNMIAGGTTTIALLAVDPLGNRVLDYDISSALFSVRFYGPTASPYGNVPLWGPWQLGSAGLFGFTDGKGTTTIRVYNREDVHIDADAVDGSVNSAGSDTYDLDLHVDADVVTHLTVQGNATQTAGQFQTVMIRARDQYGNTNPTYNGDKAIVFSGPAVSYHGSAPTATDKNGTPIVFGGATTIAFSQGLAYSDVVLYSRESTSIDLSDGTFSSSASTNYDLDVVVSSTGTLSIPNTEVNANPNPTGFCGEVGVWVIARDIYGNQLERGGASVAVSVAGANSATPAMLDVGNGSYSGTYPALSAGVDQITGSINSVAITRDTDYRDLPGNGYLSDGTYFEQIDAGNPTVAIWTGSVDSNWFRAANWAGGVVPTDCHVVVVDGLYSNAPLIDHTLGPARMFNLTVGATRPSVLTTSFASAANSVVVHNNLVVGPFGTITHTANTNTTLHRLLVNVEGNLDVQINGAISALGKGFSNGNGPGGSNSNSYGAAHGGNSGSCAPTTSPGYEGYGSVMLPITLGSGGYHSGAPTVPQGGGSIELTVTGALTLAGKIEANAASVTGCPIYWTSGAGGSILIRAGQLSGNGLIQANGGGATTCSEKGGGGGRVAIYFHDSTYDFSTIENYSHMTTCAGGAGTTYIQDLDEAEGRLVVDARNDGVNTDFTSTSSETPILNQALALKALTVQRKARLRLRSGSAVTLSALTMTATTKDASLMIDSGTTFLANNLTNLQDFTVIQSGVTGFNSLGGMNNVAYTNNATLNLPVISTILVSQITNNGYYNHSSTDLSIAGGTSWLENAPVHNFGNSTHISTISIPNGTLEFKNQSPSNPATYSSVNVGPLGVLTHTANQAAVSYSLNLLVDSLVVQNGGKIDVTQKGYSPNNGPGRVLGGSYGPGAGHGGNGGQDAWLNSGGASYGSIIAPITLGSGGTSYSGANAAGGGAVRIVATTSLQLDGQIISNGGGFAGANPPGGGSGGSVYLTSALLAGAGSVTANGGPTISNSGAGAGGRIAVYYDSNSGFGLASSLRAYGGTNSPCQPGGAGTVYYKQSAEAYGHLRVDNNNQLGAATPQPSGTSLTLASLYVGRAANFTVPLGASLNFTPSTSLSGDISGVLTIQGQLFLPSDTYTINSAGSMTIRNYGEVLGTRDLTVTNSYVVFAGQFVPALEHLTIATAGSVEYANTTPIQADTLQSLLIQNGGMLTHSANTTTTQYTLNLLLDSLVIEGGGTINLDAKGFGPSSGPCAGVGAAGPSGACHGGESRGGLNNLFVGEVYGSIVAPIALGSGGGGNSATCSGRGGGAVKISSDSSQISGSISARGVSCTGDSNRAAGAGGSVWISANSLTGTGQIYADGGDGMPSITGPGGGGRIALYYGDSSILSFSRVSAYGGFGYNNGYAGAGTVFLKAASEAWGRVYIDNNLHTGARTPMPVGAAHLALLQAANGGIYMPRANDTVQIDLLELRNLGKAELFGVTDNAYVGFGDIHVFSGGVITHSANSNINAHHVALHADNLTVDSGGSIDVSYLGFINGQGPGATTGNGGPGHGGVGAAGTTGPAGDDYGTIYAPIDLGSGGSCPAVSMGGGAMLLQIAQDFTLNGQLLARGKVASGASCAGGSGGSVLVSTYSLHGNGYINADGGNSVSPAGGAAGGRIALLFFEQTFLSDGGHITSVTPGQYSLPKGGTGQSTAAEGTLYFAQPDHYTITGNSAQVAGTSQEVIITFVDNHNNPFYYTGSRIVRLGGANSSINGVPPTCTNSVGQPIAFGNNTYLDFVAGVATCQMTLYRAELAEIEIDDAIYSSLSSRGDPSWDLNVSVGPSPNPSPANSVISASHLLATVGSNITAMATLHDYWANRIYTGGQNVQLRITGPNVSDPSVVDNLNGTYTASYPAQASGLDLITGSVNSAQIEQDTDGTNDGIYHLWVTGGAATHFEISGATSQTAGTYQEIQIAARDAFRELDTSYSGDRLLVMSSAQTSARGDRPTCRDKFGQDIPFGDNTAVTFDHGLASCRMYLYKVELAEIDTTDGTHSSFGDLSWDIDVNVGISHLNPQGTINATPNPVEKSFPVLITVVTFDTFGNPYALGGRAVALTISGANILIPSVNDQGNGTYAADYVPSNSGIDEISGTIGVESIADDSEGVSDGVYHLTVRPRIVPTHYEVTGPSVFESGNPGLITITARDNSGVTARTFSGLKALRLSGPQPSQFGVMPSCMDWINQPRELGLATQLSFLEGVAHCDLRLFRAETNSVDVDDGLFNSFGADSYDLDVTVSPLEPDARESILSASPNPVNTGGVVTVEVQTYDTYGNIPQTIVSSLIATVSGANSASFALNSVTNGLYRSSYTPSSGGLDLITAHLESIPLVHDNDGYSDGQYRLTVRPQILPTHLEITGVNSQPAGSSQQIAIWAKDDQATVAWNYSGIKNTTLSGPGIAIEGSEPTCTDKDGIPRAISQPIALDFVDGIAHCHLVLYKLEQTTLEASVAALSSTADESYDLNIAVTGDISNANRTSIFAASLVTEPGNRVSLWVETRDRFGNKVVNPDYVNLTVSGANSAALIGYDDGTGTFRTSYTPANTGNDLINGTINGIAIQRDEDGVTDGTFHLLVRSPVLATHLEVKGTTSQKGGESQQITIEARDENATVSTPYSGERDIYLSGANSSPDGMRPSCSNIYNQNISFGKPVRVVFTNGIGHCTLMLYKAETATINVSDRMINSYTDPAHALVISVSADSSPAQIHSVLDVTPASIQVGNSVTVKNSLTDTYGNPVDLSASAVVFFVDGEKVKQAPSKTGVGIYQHSFVTTKPGVNLITSTVSAKPVTNDTDGNSDGIFHLTVTSSSRNRYSISGTVYWGITNAQKASGVLVSDGYRFAYTGSDGKYQLSGVPEGRYTLSGLFEGYTVTARPGVNPVSIVGEAATGRDLQVNERPDGYPVKLYASWNGFLGNFAIVELFNTSTEDLRARLTLYTMNGTKADSNPSTITYRIAPGEEKDVILNDMIGFDTDSYGVIELALNRSEYSGQVSYYKLTPQGQFRADKTVADDFDYALPNALESPTIGTSFLSYNTIQPSVDPAESNYLVPNWLTIVNTNKSAVRIFRITKFDSNGQKVPIPDKVGLIPGVCDIDGASVRCRIAPMGRIDIDGGHVHPGAGRSGLIEIVPENNLSPYIASIVRYGNSAPPTVYSARYSFGVYLQSSRSIATTTYLPIGRSAAQDNWLELSNTTDSKISVTANAYDSSGVNAGRIVVRIAPRAQRHLSVSSLLPKDRSGYVELSSSASGALLATSISYYRNLNGGISALYAEQPSDLSSERIFGSYNLYLGMRNNLLLTNTEGTTQKLFLNIYQNGKAKQYPLSLKAHSSLSMALDDTAIYGLSANSLGMLRIDGGKNLLARVLRLKPGPGNNYDFLMSAKIR